jgi:hypothetical protein
MYRTGDRGYWSTTGDLYFRGRSDKQVKIRGHRVETDEVAAVLRDEPRVRDAVVLPEDIGERTQLVAYVVLSAGTSADQDVPVCLRDHASAHLPSYMVPRAVVILPHLPLTARGKLDRQALPAPDAAEFGDGRAAYVAPRTPTEATLAGIWRELVGSDRVGVADNFFEIGGDSILGVRLVARANEAGIPLTNPDIYRRQTIEEQAAVTPSTPHRLAHESSTSAERSSTVST